MNRKRINTENEVFLKLLRGPAHGRALAEELQYPLTTVQRALNMLTEKNALTYDMQGKNKVYSVKRNLHARLQAYSAEHYKLIRLIGKYPYLGPLLEDITRKCPDILILLFGSYAKFSAKKDSDIDLYVQTTDKELKKNIESMHSKLSVKTGNFDKDDLLIKEIIKNHVVIQGVERFYEETKFFG